MAKTGCLIRKTDKLKIGGAQLARIEYSFANGKLYSIAIFCKGRNNCESLKEALIAKYGRSLNDGVIIDHSGNLVDSQKYIWRGSKTDIMFF